MEDQENSAHQNLEGSTEVPEALHRFVNIPTSSTNGIIYFDAKSTIACNKKSCISY